MWSFLFVALLTIPDEGEPYTMYFSIPDNSRHIHALPKNRMSMHRSLSAVIDRIYGANYCLTKSAA